MSLDSASKIAGIGSWARGRFDESHTRKVASMRITTNKVPRNWIDGSELTAKERAEFDYHDWKAIDVGTESASFFRYRGELYDLGAFMRTSDGLAAEGWHGYYADSHSTGTVVRYTDDCGAIIVGYYVA